MKTSLLLITSLFFAHGAFAHGTHDWRKDRAAYRSVKLLKSPSLERAGPPPPMLIDPELLKGILTEISVKIKERGSKEGRALVRKYLADEYQKLGFKTSEHVYAANSANFVAELPGKDPSKIVIISSHIDSVGNAGANDDGIGTAAALAIAQVIAKGKYSYTLRVLGFDEEEDGLVGSRHYVKKMTDGKSVIADIHMEMMGYNGKKDGKFHVIDCDRKESTFVTDLILKSIEDLSLSLQINKACTDRSDHASFWKAKIPAVVISENFFGGDSDPCYHRTCDILDQRLDFGYASKITEAITHTVKQILIPVE